MYEAKDGKYLAVGALEPRFFATLAGVLGLSPEDRARHMSPGEWPLLRGALSAAFRTKTRDEWCALLGETDSCVAPVLSWAEAKGHPHLKARGTFVDIDGVTQPAPAPRFSRTQPAVPHVAHEKGADTDAALRDWGFTQADLDALEGPSC